MTDQLTLNLNPDGKYWGIPGDPINAEMATAWGYDLPPVVTVWVGGHTTHEQAPVKTGDAVTLGFLRVGTLGDVYLDAPDWRAPVDLNPDDAERVRLVVEGVATRQHTNQDGWTYYHVPQDGHPDQEVLVALPTKHADVRPLWIAEVL